MKIFFYSLLIFNILFAIIGNYQTIWQDNKSASSVFNREKIKLLPAHIDCIVWSDFSGQTLQQAETAIKAMDIKKPYKQVLSSVKTKYWVHTAPYNDQSAAKREINKLRNMGIISYRVQEKGPWLNAISFGMLESNSAANKLIKKLEKKGFNKVSVSKVSANKRKTEHRQFLFLAIDAHKLDKLQNLASQFPDSRLVHTTCERL